MSRLVEPGPGIYQNPEPGDLAYGYSFFKQLPYIPAVQNVSHKASP